MSTLALLRWVFILRIVNTKSVKHGFHNSFQLEINLMGYCFVYRDIFVYFVYGVVTFPSEITQYFYHAIAIERKTVYFRKSRSFTRSKGKVNSRTRKTLVKFSLKTSTNQKTYLQLSRASMR